MKIRWIGHASFQIETAGGLRIRTDPYDSSIGLPESELPADVVTVSHEHYDHNCVKSLPGKPAVIRGEKEQVIRGATFKGVLTYHDEDKGAKRGRNTAFLIKADGISLVHLGDLGHILAADQAAAFGKVDILFIPVGGNYTIDAGGADQTIATLGPSITIPMHYRIPGLNVQIAPVDSFLAGKAAIRRLDELDVTAQSLPKSPETVVLNPRP